MLPGAASSPMDRDSLTRLLLLLAIASLALAQPNATLQSDYDALVGFLAGIDPIDGTVLAQWDATDPCAGGWPGVICSCEGLPWIAAAGCNDSTDASGHRVLALDLGPLTTAAGDKLQGTISPMLGNLTALVYLDVSSNALRGGLPDTLAGLASLQWLQAASNQLSGGLPAALSQMPSLKQVLLSNNNFQGPVPSSWCANNASYDIAHNTNLCGLVPKCLSSTNRVSSIQGTYLTTSALQPFGSAGGACDNSAPDCDKDVGCVIWTPKYWSSLSVVAFNFTGFMDYQSGVVAYAWGVGSRPFAADVVPLLPVVADRVLKDIRYSGAAKKMFVTPVVHNLTTLSLREGRPYYVTVVAFNGAGPPLQTNTTSAPVFVDTSGPTPGAVFNTYNFEQASTTNLLTSLQASWDDFKDTQSGLQEYTVQFIQQVRNERNGSVELVELTQPMPVGRANRVQLKVPQPLEQGTTYYSRVIATNGAGLSTTVPGQPITVDSTKVGGIVAAKIAVMMVLSGLACLAVGATLSVFFIRASMHKQQRKEKERQQESKQLKALMYALVSTSDGRGGIGCSSATTGSAAQPAHEPQPSDAEVALVFTDIESSTELSHQDPEAFKQLQEVHDQIMREAIARHNGYEIITEGDSFQVAFASCQSAMAFCSEAQYRLLEQTWSKEVLRLNACKPIKGADGELLMAGPRVRMGLHWACKGSVAVRLHSVTRHKVYQGPGVVIATDVSEAANGGQILLTEDAVAQLSGNMSMAGFPIVRLEGLYQLPSVPGPIYLFSCTEVVGRPLRRSFASLRKSKKIWPQARSFEKMPATLVFNINPPPLPDASNCLAFACLRLTTFPRSADKPECSLPRLLQERLDEVFAVQAQQFKGYLFQTHEHAFSQGLWAVAFQSSVDAMRFAHAAQMLLMHTQWPAWAQPYCGQSVPSPDGRWLFHGPRVVMALHESPDFFVAEDGLTDPLGPRRAMCFAGPAVALPLVLTYAGRGGQVLLSERAWDAVKPAVTQHPGAVTVISLGMHKVSDDFPVPMLLMEVMPNLLAKRVFHSALTKRLIEPGYREAPDPREPMAIMFVKVSKPAEVVDAEKGGGATQDAKLLIQEYQMSVSMYVAAARKLLRKYDGYECKEPEPGKFTLAFRELHNAVAWACHLQEELLYLKWPSRLLAMRECAEQRDEAGQVVWCGLRVRAGVAYGLVSTKKPLNSGRADYFGVLPNSAARVMGLADSGQVLIEAGSPPMHEGQLLLQPTRVTQLTMLSLPGASSKAGKAEQAAAHKAASEAAAADCVDPRTIRIHAVGYFILRGLDNARLIYEARGVRLALRDIKPPADMLMPAAGSTSGRSTSSSFASSRDSLCRNWSSWVERRGWFAGTAGRYSPSPVPGSPSSSPNKGATQRAGARSSSPQAAAGTVSIEAFAGVEREPKQPSLRSLLGAASTQDLLLSTAGEV